MSDGAEAQVERLAEEYIERLRGGDEPDIEEYVRAHPELESDIRRVFQVVAVMEGIKPSPRELRATGATGQSMGDATRDPEQVGEFEIVRRIGRGGMGRVFEARGPGGERVALKLIHPHLLAEPGYVDRFLQEARLGQRVDHANVVRTLGTGTFHTADGEAPYLVLEYVEGQDLKGLLREVEVVPERLARHIGLRVADALVAVHAAGIVHRDLKPENVIITADEDVKLMDMGVGLLLEQERRLSRTGQFVGSLLYAAPEQLGSGTPDGRTDLYSLGLMLYELVTGALPGGGLHERRAGLDASTWTDAARVSPFFLAVLRTLLAPAPHDRFESSAALGEILRDGDASPWWQARKARAPGPERLPVPHHDASRPLFGRESELRRLSAALESVRNRRGRVVWIEGDAGIGKSRLVGDWLRTAMEAGVPLDIVFVRHEPGEHGAATTPLASAIVDRLGAADLEATLEDVLAEAPHLVGPMSRFLLRTAASDEGFVDPVSIDMAYLAIMRRLAREAPVVLVIEDLHFATELTENTFLHLARNVSEDPILVIGTARPGANPRCPAELAFLDHADRVTLAGLSLSDGHELFLDAVENRSASFPTVEAVEKAGGNPLFLLELARSWQRTSDLQGREAASVEIPSSIRSLFEARFARLEEKDRELLDVAACFGAEFDPLVVASAAGAGDLAGLKTFARVERAGGILRAEGAVYRFDHHLLHEAFYETIHPGLRQRYHAAIARRLEEDVDAPDKTEGAQALLLARQWLLGAEPLAAEPYLRAALRWLIHGQLASRIFHLRDLIEPYEESYSNALRAHLRERFALFEYQRRPHEEVLERLETALALSDPDGEPRIYARTLNAVGKAKYFSGDMAGAIEAYEQALAYSEARDDDHGCADSLEHLGRIYNAVGRIDEAIEALERALEHGKACGHPQIAQWAHAALSTSFIVQNRFAEAEAAAQRTIELSRAAGDVGTEVSGRASLCRILYRRGKYVPAAEAAAEVQRSYRDMGLQRNLTATTMVLVDVWAELGELEAADRAAREAVGIAKRLGDPEATGFTLNLLARAAAARGRLAEGWEALAGSMQCAQEIQTPLLDLRNAQARHRLGLMSGRLDEVEAALAEAEAALGTRTDPLNRALLMAAAAQLGLEKGAADEACEGIDRGIALLDEFHVGSLRGEFYLPRAQGERLRQNDEACVHWLERAAAWARESEAPSTLAVALAHLGRYATEDLMAAKVLVERDAGRIRPQALMEAHFALWEATWSLPFLKEARALLSGLRANARPEDREALMTNVALHRAIARAGR